MNNSLATHYLAMDKFDGDTIMGKFTIKNCLELLNFSNINWTYEIEKEYYPDAQTDYNVNVVVYMPGRVMTGTAIGDVEFHKEYRSRTIRKAICDALVNMYKKEMPKLASKTAPVPPAEVVIPPVTPTAEVPLVEAEIMLPVEKVKKSKFSPEQIVRVTKFKEEMNIETPEQFLHYLTAWDKNITSKKQLTATNIDTFLDWVETFFDGELAI